jgi:chemotaxis signal transduction protein
MAASLQELIDQLEGADVRERVARMIDELGCVNATDAEMLMDSLDARLCGIASSLRDVIYEDDTTEALSMLPWLWLELRFEWMRYNMQMQYQTMLRGTAEPTLMARGAALSYVLEMIEFYLDADSASIVAKIAADPAGVAHSSIERTERLFQLMSAASAGGREAVEVLLLAQDQIARHTDSVLVRDEFSKAIGAVIERIGGALRVSAVDFAHAIEGMMAQHFRTASVRVVVEDGSPDKALMIPSAVANGLLKAAGDWMVALRETSMKQDARTRIAAARPAYVTVRATLTRDGNRVTLIIEDDADGTVDYRPSWRVWPIRDFKLHLKQTEGGGSAIRYSCEVTSITDYMMLRVGPEVGDALIGVPLRMVEHLEQRDASALALQGTRIVRRNDGGTVQLIDLGASLFRTAIPTDDATYVLVRPDGEEGDVLALRVRSVDGICRGSLKSMPGVLAEAPLRGFVQADRQIVGVLDFDLLLDRHEHEAGRMLVSAA